MFNSIEKNSFSFNGGEYYIELSPLTNTIRVSVVFKEAILVYLVGDFNNWEKKEYFKLDLTLDEVDGKAKFTKDITFPLGLKRGEYNYGYIITNINGEEEIISNLRENNEAFKFFWEPFKESLEILSSRNLVSKTYPVEIVPVKKSFYGNTTTEDTTILSLEENYEGVILKDGILSVNKNAIPRSKILIKAKDPINNMVAYKEIEVIEEEEKGVFLQFIKNDKFYYGENFSWNIWNFEEGGEGKEVNLSIKTDLGLGAFLDYKNFIIRKRTWGYNFVNDWNEQSNTFSQEGRGKNLYCLYEKNIVLSSLKEAIEESSPKIEFALMDNKNSIHAFLSHKPLIGIRYGLYINGIRDKEVIIKIKEREREVLITNIHKEIDPSDLIEIRASSMFSSCKVTLREVLKEYYYGGQDLGIKFSKDSISLRLWSPTAKKVEVLIYENYKDLKEEPIRRYETFRERENGTYKVKISRKENENKYYLYRLYFNELNKNLEAINKVTYAIDPYAVAVGINGDKGVLLDLYDEGCLPKDWYKDNRSKLKNIEDSIIYEMHIRDFTIDESSKVCENLRGKFLGAVEEGTYYMDYKRGIKIKTGIDHLKELGITHVHLLPVFDFASVDERDFKSRNWGYDPKNFNALEGSYSSNPYDPKNRILEFREMVKKFHDNNIGVILDVVYNHMYDTKNMDNIVPKYYFRSDKRGKYTNGSGCGNEIASERPMIRKYILDSIMHWVKNYHIDGLRFDLMELIDIDTMKEIVKRVKEVDERILIYGEPWKGGDSPLKDGTYKGSQKGLKLSIFNDDFRNALRGNNSPSKGYINGEQHNKEKAWLVVEGLKGSINTIAYSPLESINYLDSHDNYTLWDQILKSQIQGIKGREYREVKEENLLENFFVREDLLGISIIFTAQGIPFMQAGSEFLRSKEGDHNSYKSDDYINGINWIYKGKYLEVFNYYKNIISLRKNYEVFKMGEPYKIRENLEVYFYNEDDKSGVIIAKYKNNSKDNNFKEMVAIYNGTTIDDYEINLSKILEEKREFKILLKDFKFENVCYDVTSSNTLKVLAHSLTIIIL